MIEEKINNTIDEGDYWKSSIGNFQRVLDMVDQYTQEGFGKIPKLNEIKNYGVKN
jgi:hypothetical protein